MAEQAPSESSSNTPMFVLIGGSMRSGTTLLQKLLCAAPTTNPVIGECKYIADQMQVFSKNLQNFELHLKDYFSSPEEFKQYNAEQLRYFLHMVHTRYTPAELLVLKNPELTRFFPELSEWLPRATFLLTVRDPRDTVASMVEVGEKHRAEGQSSQLTTLGRNMAALSGYYLSYYAPLFSSPEPTRQKVGLVRYEQLVTDPQAALAPVAQHCGISIPAEAFGNEALEQQSMEAWNRYREDKFTGAFWSPLYHQGVSDSRVGRFSETLTEEEVEAVQEHCTSFNRIVKYW
jgi:hypothetical protein